MHTNKARRICENKGEISRKSVFSFPVNPRKMANEMRVETKVADQSKNNILFTCILLSSFDVAIKNGKTKIGTLVRKSFSA